MSRWRRPHGQYVRQTADWFVSRLMSGGATQAASAGLFSAVNLANDSVQGLFLHVVGLDFFIPSTTAFGKLTTRVGLTFSGQSAGYQASVSPMGALGPGFCKAQAQTGINGTILYTLGGGQIPYTWVHPWPLIILPPGYTLTVYSSVSNVDITAAWYWLPMEPE